jgi:hypothetical protein
MNNLIARTRVVLTAAPTHLVSLAVILTIVSEQVAELLPMVPAGTAETAARWLVTLAGSLTAAVSIIRRVTPVLPTERGVLPADSTVE